jgi:hypothetical protein
MFLRKPQRKPQLLLPLERAKLLPLKLSRKSKKKKQLMLTWAAFSEMIIDESIQANLLSITI